jgi:hypothetical protein
MNRFFRFGRIFRFNRKQDHLGLLVLLQQVDFFISGDERGLEGDRLEAL